MTLSGYLRGCVARLNATAIDHDHPASFATPNAKRLALLEGERQYLTVYDGTLYSFRNRHALADASYFAETAAPAYAEFVRRAVAESYRGGKETVR